MKMMVYFKNTQELYFKSKYVLKTIEISGYKNSIKRLLKKFNEQIMSSFIVQIKNLKHLFKLF